MRDLLAVAIVLVPASTSAGTFSTALPELVGPADFPISFGKEASFDLEQRFRAIENVWIEIEAQVFAQEFDFCGTVFDPQPCVYVVNLLGFFALMDTENSPSFGLVFSDALSFSEDPGAPEASGIDRQPFSNRSVGWDFLLDGKGMLTLAWNGTLGFPEDLIQNYQDPSGQIFAARIIVDGQPVPEPSTALTFLVGLVMLSAGTRLRTKSFLA